MRRALGAWFSLSNWSKPSMKRARVAKKQNKAVDKISITSAIKNLDRRFLDKWKTARGKHLSAAALETRYHEAVKMSKRARMVYPPLQELGKLYINSKPD